VEHPVFREKQQIHHFSNVLSDFLLCCCYLQTTEENQSNMSQKILVRIKKLDEGQGQQIQLRFIFFFWKKSYASFSSFFSVTQTIYIPFWGLKFMKLHTSQISHHIKKSLTLPFAQNQSPEQWKFLLPPGAWGSRKRLLLCRLFLPPQSLLVAAVFGGKST
jgi:hypothetical protein